MRIAAMPGLKRSDELEKHGVFVSRASSKIAIASASVPATGLSMNTGLRALKHRPRLLEVRPAVDALEQHDVDLRSAARRSSRRSSRRTSRAAPWCNPPRDRGWTGCPGSRRETRPRPARRPARAWELAAFKSLVNATTCEVSRPMMPARRGFDLESSWASPDFANRSEEVTKAIAAPQRVRSSDRSRRNPRIALGKLKLDEGHARSPNQKSSSLRGEVATPGALFEVRAGECMPGKNRTCTIRKSRMRNQCPNLATIGHGLIHSGCLGAERSRTEISCL